MDGIELLIGMLWLLFEALGDAILGLLRDPDKRRRLAGAGRAAVAARTLAGMAAAVGAVYRDAVRRGD